jgi:hypothetical protein
LRKFFRFTQQTDTFSNYHGGYCCMDYSLSQERIFILRRCRATLTGSQYHQFQQSVP